MTVLSAADHSAGPALRTLSEVRRAGRVLAFVAALVAGAGAGVLGSFAYAGTAAGMPVGLILGLGLSVAVFATAGLATRGRTAPGFAAIAWVVVVVLLSMRRPEGDLVVTGSLLGSLWLLAGSLLAGAAVAWPYALRPSDEPLRPAVHPEPASASPSTAREPDGR